MKVWNTIVKILVALAAIAGIVYVAATYGDKIVAWCKKLLNSLPCKCCEEGCCDCDAQEEVVAEEEVADEAVAAEADTVVAEEKDFEG